MLMRLIKTLDRKKVTIKHKKSSSELSNSSYNNNYDDSMHDGYKSAAATKHRHNKSMSKGRSKLLVKGKYKPRRGISTSKYSKTSKLTSDFDVDDVKNGMNDIDLLLEELEENMPEDVLEHDDYEVDELLKTNRALKDKIKDISEMVISAIQKASQLKRKIVTHRDAPPDPAIKYKNKEIK
jgi:hypothetical protein